MSFQNKVVVVTGAGSGMGRAMVEEFNNKGAFVVAIGRTASKLEETLSKLNHKDTTKAFVVDVGNERQIAECIAKVESLWGKVDVLINNAGVLDSYAPVHEVSLEEWKSTLKTNLTGPFLMAKYCIPSMLKHNQGVILNISSVSAHSAAGGGSAYTASKHAVEGLTRQLCFEYGSKGIRVNSICPGATATPMAIPDLKGDFDPDRENELSKIPAQRWCQPNEIAKYAAFLASDDASYIHGASCVIDGGWLTGSRYAFD